MSVKGSQSVDSFHRKLGKIMWDKCGMSRNETGLKEAIEEIKVLRQEFWKDVRVTGKADEFNQELEKAGRVADFLELGELFAKDALDRNESCGGHFREESVEQGGEQDGEAKRETMKIMPMYQLWEFKGEESEPVLHKEDLKFEYIELKQRSYK